MAGDYRFDATAQADLLRTFERLRTSFVNEGVPVILGEYGLLGFDRHTGTIEPGEKLKFFELFGQQARASKVTTMLWDNGRHFDRAFVPDCAAGAIKLTPEFFAEVTDGAPVTLTFVFWSGETVSYRVTRTGTTVTGALVSRGGPSPGLVISLGRRAPPR